MNQVEHLVLQWVGGFQPKFKTKYHNDLGYDLQSALDALEREGWQVVAAFDRHAYGTCLILTRTAN